jgi:hypothetical protein
VDSYKIKKLSSYPRNNSPSDDDLVPCIVDNGDGTFKNVNIPVSVLKWGGTTDYNQLTNKPDLTLKADKNYVDSQDAVLAERIDTGLGNKVNKAGDTMTGNLTVPSVTVNGSNFLTGTGSPNGVVVAPVGSTYIDRDATNGAIRWIKKTGRNSVNGWAIDYGDTGWRNITPNPLPANIDKTDCKIRRVNDVVEVAIGYTSVINATEMVYTNSLPLGFRPAQNVFVTGTSTGPGTSRTGGVAIDGTRIRWQSTVGNWRTAYARYTTDDPWPISLPGTAA